MGKPRESAQPLQGFSNRNLTAALTGSTYICTPRFCDLQALVGPDCYSRCLPSAFSVVAPLYGHVYTCSLSFSFTCEPARRLSMASPPLQKKEVVASFRHPEFQGVFKKNFLRVQPHIFQKGGTDREESPGCVVPCSGGPDNLSGRLSSRSGAAWSSLTAARKLVSP